MSNEAVGGAYPEDAEGQVWPAWQPPLQVDAAAELENLRAMLAQVSAVLPIVGPLIAWSSNQDHPFARREAAKAFNGQVFLVVMMVAVVPLMYPVYLAMNPWFNFHDFYGIGIAEVALIAIWGAHALSGALSARAGVDWVSPLQRIIGVRLLPEGESDPRRQLRRGSHPEETDR